MCHGEDLYRWKDKNLQIIKDEFVWPCVVVSPHVPARGTTPLSTWRTGTQLAYLQDPLKGKTIFAKVGIHKVTAHPVSWQTLMPIRMPLSRIILTKGTPLLECWYRVSWKKMTPPMQLLMRSSALKRIWRYCLRFSSVFSTPTWDSLLAMLPAAKTPMISMRWRNAPVDFHLLE